MNRASRERNDRRGRRAPLFVREQLIARRPRIRRIGPILDARLKPGRIEPVLQLDLLKLLKADPLRRPDRFE